jgi:hypothetical protein
LLHLRGPIRTAHYSVIFAARGKTQSELKVDSCDERRSLFRRLDAIPLDTFFERLGAIEEEELGKTEAFRALAQWFAEAPPPARQDEQEDTDED